VEEWAGPSSPLLDHSSLFTTVNQPSAGAFPIPGPVARAQGWAGKPPAPAPLLGEDTPSVLADWLGSSPAEIAELRQAGVVLWDDRRAETPSPEAVQ
jgi:crotonobetainyl-CoA:carnitine CoA-transferase CaiB-like acyl-CoA transferase